MPDRSTALLVPLLVSLGAAPAAGGELIKVLPADGATADRFGYSVGIDGSTAVVGAPWDGDNGVQSGSAYLFDTVAGQELAKLRPADGAAGDVFGVSVAIGGSTAIVGANHDDDNGSASGSAYLFDTTTGQELRKLLPSDGAAEDRFGRAVGIDGTLAVVGSTGSAYLFDATTGSELAKLLPNDATVPDEFGFHVAIRGTTAIVGAPGDDANGVDSGSAYLFDTTTGQQLFKLLPADGAAGDRFGAAVDVDGSTAIVGAHLDDDNGSGSGSCYLFDVATGQELAKLVPSDGWTDDWFGLDVAIDGPTAVVGAWHDDDGGPDSGSAYLFDVATGQQRAKLLPSDGSDHDEFGWSVALAAETALFGVWQDDDNGFGSGSAYVFDASPYASFCNASDGSLDACPCANPGHPGTGCDVSQSTGGVRLEVLARATQPSNRATLRGSGYPSAAAPTSVVIRATTLDAGAPVVFGDGLRCIGTPLVRLGATFAAAGASTHVVGHGTTAGPGEFFYQLWFRNTPAMSCTPDAFNLSNGRRLTW